MRRMIFVLAIGMGGLAILLALGAWQVQRLAWKESLLARIDARIAGDVAPLPAAPEPGTHGYLPVEVSGRFGDDVLRVLVSQKLTGAAYRLVQPLETDEGRRILVDRGVVPADGSVPLPEGGAASIIGNLHWPDEQDSFTPDPDVADNIWYARDLEAMARLLDTEPLLVVARSDTGGGITPLPVGTEGIPNDHLKYAITWFSLAVVWAGMTGLWLWRIRRRKNEGMA